MYAWLWRHFPGPLPVRLITAVALTAVIVVLLFGFVFPWLEPLMPFSGNTTVH